MTETQSVPNPPPGPLAGVTILDLSRVLAGPFCTMVLGNLGARVIKIEIPGRGDDSRHVGPFIEGVSAYFTSVNRGKESLALDLKDSDDRKIFERLLARSDVLTENFRPGVMEKLGYGWDDLHAQHPRLIYAATSGYGHTGPHAEKAAYDMVVQGLGGIMSVTGHEGGPPTRVGVSVGDIAPGLYTAIGICSALYHRALTGQGMKVDVGMLDSQIAIMENPIARYFAAGEIPGPGGAQHASIAPFGAFRTADDYIIIATGNDNLFIQLCAALERPELTSDARYLTNDLRIKNVDALIAEIEARLATRPAREWLALIEAAGVPCGPINTVAEAVEHPQILARNMIVSVDDPQAGILKVAGNPVKFSAFEDAPARSPAPALDGDREKILAELEHPEPAPAHVPK